MTGWRRRDRHAALLRSFLVFALVLFCPSGPAASRAGQRSSFTGGSRLADIYDAILDARFTDASKLIDQSCAPRQDPGDAPRSRNGSSERAPAEACQLLGVVSLWW